MLATHFTGKYAGDSAKQIAPQAMEVLLNYSWPGNIRELENAIERACVTSRDPLIQVDNLPSEIVAPVKPDSTFTIDLNKPLADHVNEAVARIEHHYISKAFEEENQHGHVGARCAVICGLSRRSITTKIAEYQLDKSVFKEDFAD